MSIPHRNLGLVSILKGVPLSRRAWPRGQRPSEDCDGSEIKLLKVRLMYPNLSHLTIPIATLRNLSKAIGVSPDSDIRGEVTSEK